MTVNEIKESLNNEEYSFLKTNERLGNNIILLGLGGSHSYGTNNEGSDVDIRGCTLNSRNEILLGRDFNPVIDNATDTVIYSLKHLFSLLSACNPNVIEILGLRPDHYLYLNDAGKEILANKQLFLSKRAVFSFGGYANMQLRRLDNMSARHNEQELREQHILNSLEHISENFNEKYSPYDKDSIKLFIDKSNREDLDSEIFMNVSLHNYPLRDYANLWEELNNVVKQYNKLGPRNTKAIEHKKLGKHMMHLVRLYYMCFDILERGEIVTYREKEQEELMKIRNGLYLNGDNKPIPEFYEMVNSLETRMQYAKNNTSLPEKVNQKEIDELLIDIIEKYIL